MKSHHDLDPNADLLTSEDLAAFLKELPPGRPDLRDPTQRPTYEEKPAQLMTPEELRAHYREHPEAAPWLQPQPMTDAEGEAFLDRLFARKGLPPR